MGHQRVSHPTRVHVKNASNTVHNFQDECSLHLFEEFEIQRKKKTNAIQSCFSILLHLTFENQVQRANHQSVPHATRELLMHAVPYRLNSATLPLTGPNSSPGQFNHYRGVNTKEWDLQCSRTWITFPHRRIN